MTSWEREFMCLWCDHFDDDIDAPDYAGPGLYCAAFPDGDGIPDDILNNKVDHRQPVEGDNGIQFHADRSEAGRRIVDRILDRLHSG